MANKNITSPFFSHKKQKRIETGAEKALAELPNNSEIQTFHSFSPIFFHKKECQSLSKP